MTEGDKKMKKEKKEKKKEKKEIKKEKKKEKDPEEYNVEESLQTEESHKKGKDKTKKRKREAAEVVNENSSERHKEEEIVEEYGTKETSSDADPAIVKDEVIQDNDIEQIKRDEQFHDKKLRNKLPTRQERQRRENQKKMQTFVAEMRAMGKTKAEIDKLKKKINAKMKYIQPNQAFSTVIALGDITLCCRECNNDFVFSVQEQQFFQEKHYEPPVRCKECTAAKKARMSIYDEKTVSSGGRNEGYYSSKSRDNEYNGMTGGGVRSNWGNI